MFMKDPDSFSSSVSRIQTAVNTSSSRCSARVTQELTRRVDGLAMIVGVLIKGAEKGTEIELLVAIVHFLQCMKTDYNPRESLAVWLVNRCESKGSPSRTDEASLRHKS